MKDLFGQAWDHLFDPPVAHRGLWDEQGASPEGNQADQGHQGQINGELQDPAHDQLPADRRLPAHDQLPASRRLPAHEQPPTGRRLEGGSRVGRSASATGSV